MKTIIDQENDRVIYYEIENDTVKAIDFRQGITDTSEPIFNPEIEILGYYNKIIAREKHNEETAITEALKKAVETYCVLNIY